jgi:soluble P-type ATPase
VIDLDVPGLGSLSLAHLVLDFNGTLARTGTLVEGVERRLFALADLVRIHVVTADTFGQARFALDRLPVDLKILKPGGESEAKAAVVRELGREHVVAMGNGVNDTLMLGEAHVSIAVIGAEGAACEALLTAMITVCNPCDGLDLLLEPKRLVATLRR